MEFRLLAQGPEALRLELFDPFGRPAYYLTVFQGRVRAVSPGDKKPLPLNPALLAAALTGESGFSLEEVLGLLWGRWPLKKDLPEGVTVTLNKGSLSRQLFSSRGPVPDDSDRQRSLPGLGRRIQKEGCGRTCPGLLRRVRRAFRRLLASGDQGAG